MPTILHRTARRLTRRLGVHGFGLVLIAFAWFFLGLRQIVDPPPVIPDGAIHGMVPVSLRLVMWWVPATMCLGAAIDGNGPRRDGFALGLAVLTPAFIMGSSFAAWAMGEYTLGWLAAIYHLVLVALVALVAAHPDDVRPSPN